MNISSQRRWVYFDIPTQQDASLDAVNQWAAKATAAAVDWDVTTTHRAEDNVAIHVAVPKLTCDLYYVVHETEEVMFRQAARSREDARRYTEETVKAWLLQRHQDLVQLDCDIHESRSHSHAGFYAYRISFVSRLNYMRLTECRGQGRKEREAKNNAARNLLDAGYCMLYDRFNSPRRPVVARPLRSL